MRPVKTKTSVPASPPAHATPVDPAVVIPSTDSPLPPVAESPMKPIGPKALAALREAIKSGQYPSEAAVKAGLERLIRR